MNPLVKKEIERFYDLIIDYFNSEISAIREFSEKYPGLEPNEVTENFVIKNEINDDEHKRVIKKEIEKYRGGNYSNHVGDRVLASICFAFNIVDPYNKSIVISDDPV